MQPKQTLYAVSRMYGVPVKTLLQINNFANPNKIKVGTAIKLPAGTKAVNSPAATLATQSVPESNTTVAAKPAEDAKDCLLYTSPSPRDYAASRMPSSA